jgi:hypothetical protein
MTFGIPNIPENHALASVVSRRIRSDTRMVTATAALYRLSGIGVFCLLLGAGVGAALYGYSYITDGRTSLEKLTTAVADALGRVVLKVGDVGVNVKGSVPLDTNSATVRLDTRGSSVALDASGVSVPINITDASPRPSPRQPDQPQSAETGAKVVVDFTIFAHVAFSEGEVQTGWKFRSNEDATPYFQYCLYRMTAKEGVTIVFALAENLAPLPPAKGLPVDAQEAFNKCQWFGNSPIGPRKST